MSRHDCELCKLTEYEYEGMRAEFSIFFSELFDNEYCYLCGDCRNSIQSKIIEYKEMMLNEIREEKKEYWEKLRRSEFHEE